jgi:hypothetical protein
MIDKYFIGAIIVSPVIPAIIFLIFTCIFLASAFPLIIWVIPSILSIVWEYYFWSDMD